MKTIISTFILSLFCIINGRKFNNPVLDLAMDPSVIKVDDTYYMVAFTPASNISIYSSTDLQTWNFETFVFTPENHPKWASETIRNPSISQVQGKFNVYFVSKKSDDTRISVAGVATSASPTGPYVASEEPFWDAENVAYPSMVFDGKYFDQF